MSDKSVVIIGGGPAGLSAAYECVKGDVQAKPYAPLKVKGKSEAVEVFEVVGLK